MTTPVYDDVHTAIESTGQWDRENYFACQCDQCGCDKDPESRDICAECRAGDHMPCAPDCAARPPHIPNN